MKKRLLITATLFLTVLAHSQVGVGTTTPRGAMEINSTTTGFLPPQVALTASNVQAPVVNPQGGAIATGTFVYNTATAGTSPNDVVPGYYFWNGSQWLLVSTQATTSSSNWAKTGNTGTSASTNFVGTTDAVDFVTRTNNTERTRIKSTGEFGIGTSAPLNYLHITEPGQVSGISTSYVKGQIITATGAGAAGGLSGPGFYFENLTNTATNRLMKMNYTSNAANKGILNFQAVSDNASTSVAAVMALTHDGLVGIGTIEPTSKLMVDGAATNATAFNAAAGTTIDFSRSNLAYTTANPSAFTLSNIKDGGTYTLAVRGTTSGTASFSAAGFTFKSVNNGATTSGKETVYTFLVMGTTVYFYMVTGF